MQGLIRAATCKLAREFTFQPQPLRVTWPYGGSDDVVLMISAGARNGAANCCSGSGSKASSTSTPMPLRVPRQGAAAGSSANSEPVYLAEVMHAGGSGSGSGNGGAKTMPRNGGIGGATQAGVPVAEGCQEIIMQRSTSGLYTADLMVRS